ncbi:MAG: hypothetical protein KC516_04365 [Nanoarchaeota archaeon]|nr:hypothetical protein [Nanoarchaeota archaeon]
MIARHFAFFLAEQKVIILLLLMLEKASLETLLKGVGEVCGTTMYYNALKLEELGEGHYIQQDPQGYYFLPEKNDPHWDHYLNNLKKSLSK